MDQGQDGSLWAEIGCVCVHLGARGGLCDVVGEAQFLKETTGFVCCRSHGENGVWRGGIEDVT